MDILLQPDWLLLSTALIALIESLAFAGIVIPGVALLFAAATLAGQQQIALPALLGSAYIGAITGDIISYWLGRYAAPFVRSHWPFNRYPSWLERGESFFQRHGGYSVVLGRFIGPIRPVIPFVAGTLGMKPGLFISLNLASALIWAPVYILPGYLIGSSSLTLSPELLPPIYLLTGVILILLLGHKLHQWLQPEQALARKLQQWLRMHHIWPQHQPIPMAAISLALISGSIFLVLLSLQLSGIAQPWNGQTRDTIWQLLQGQPILLLSTLMGDKALLVPMILLMTGILWWRKNRSLGLIALSTVIAAILCNSALKLLIQFPRPDTGQWLTSFSFPSGHTSAAAVTLFVIAALIAAPFQPALRRWIYLLMAIPVFAVALSRVALGVHWPLDVLAAICEGVFFASILRIVSAHYGWQNTQTKKTSLILSLIFLAGLAGYLMLQYNSTMIEYGLKS